MSRRHTIRGAGCTLTVVEFGDPGGPPVVVLHGLRDHAMSMRWLAEALADRYRVIVPDLRGHGDSDKPGSYALVEFVADLMAVIRHFGLEAPILIGHSLGGHIVCKYAALYPEVVTAVIVADGLGGPPIDVENPIEHRRRVWQSNVQTALELQDHRRRMTDAVEARQRLRENNPLISEELCRTVVEYGIEPHPGGGVRWKWDPMVPKVWGTFNLDENEMNWRMIECPTLIVTGDRAMDHWARLRRYEGDLGVIHDKAIERSLAAFSDARHVQIDDAGHMLHYDQPAQLNTVIKQFLETLPA